MVERKRRLKYSAPKAVSLNTDLEAQRHCNPGSGGYCMFAYSTCPWWNCPGGTNIFGGGCNPGVEFVPPYCNPGPNGTRP